MATSTSKAGAFPIILIAIFLLLPVFKISSVVDHTMVPRQLFGSVGTGILLLMLLAFGPKKPFPVSMVIASFSGLLIMSFISVFAAINPIESWATISRYLLAFAFLVTLIYMLRHAVVSAHHVIKAVVLFGAVAGIITLFELLAALGSGEFFSDIYSVTGNFSHKNLLSSALMLSLPFAIMGASTLEKMWKKGSLALVFLLIIEMFVLRTRGVWLSVFVSAFCTFLVFWAVRKKLAVNIRFPYKLVGLGLGISVLLIVLLFSASGIKEKVTDASNLSKRMVFWENSIAMVKENPLVGVGAGNWKINFPKYGIGGLDYNVAQGITHVQRPHNDYLWILSESGPLALIFFLGIFAAAFWYIRENLRQVTSGKDVTIDLAIVFGLIAYMTFSITDFPLERSSHNIVLMALIALIFRNGWRTFKTNVPFTPMILGLLAAVIFSLVVSGYRWLGESHSMDVLNANANRDAQGIIPAAEEALNPFYNMDNFSNPVYYYSSLGKLVLKMPDEALKDALMAYEIAPYNIITLTQVGNVYRAKEDIEEAFKYYDKATAISPNFEAGRFTKAELYLNRKEYVKAYEELAMVNPNTRDPRMAQQLPYTLQEIIRTKDEHGRFIFLIEFMEPLKLETPEDYMKAYREFRSGVITKEVEGTKS